MKRSSSTRSRSGAATRKASSSGRRSAPRSSAGAGTRRTASKRTTSRPTSKRTAARRPSARRSIPWPVYIAFLLAFALWSFYPAARVEYAEQREKARLEAQLIQLRQRNTTLREQVDRLKTPEGVEDLARRNLGYVEPGENAYVVGDSEEATPVVSTARSTEASSSLGQRILDYVFAVR